MSKLLTNLIERAERTGSANLNGRIIERDYGHVYKGDLEEKYHIDIHKNILTFRHWGTETLKADLSTKKVISFYGQSVSDRDSLNYLTNHFSLPYSFRWLPSKDEFQMINTENKEITII